MEGGTAAQAAQPGGGEAEAELEGVEGKEPGVRARDGGVGVIVDA